MKPKTVILLVICGSLLLLVGAFAVFFARGGEVLTRGETTLLACGELIEADEAIAEEIAKMDFNFSPIPEMTVYFQGQESRPCKLSQEGEISSIVSGGIRVSGKSLEAFPTGRVYLGISGEECQKQLIHEIQSRLSEGSEFQFIHDMTDSFQEYPERFRQKNR